MKKWLILVGLVAALIAVVVVAVVNLEAYLNENKSWLEEQAAAAVGRPVTFERVGVAVWPGLAIDLEGLRIQDDPDFSKGNLVEIAEVRIRVDLISAVFGNLDVSGIVVEQPVLTLIRTSEGLNLDTLGAGDAAPPSGSSAGDATPEEASPPLAAVIAFLDISQGEIRYLDRSSDPPVELRIEQLDFEASNVGLEEAIQFSLAASLLSKNDRQNVRLEGTVGPIVLEAPLQTPVDVRLDGLWAADERLAQLVDLAAMGAEVRGDLALTVSATGTPEQLMLNLALDGTAAAVRYDGSFDKPAGTPFALTCACNLLGDMLEINEGEIVVDDARVGYTGKLSLDSLDYDVKLASEPISLADRQSLLPSLEGLGLAGSVALDVAASGAGASSDLPRLVGSVALAGIEVRVPDTPPITGLSGSIQLRDGGVFLAPSPLAVGGAAGSLSFQIPDLARPVATLSLTSGAGSYEGVDYDSLDVALTYATETSRATIDRFVLAAYGGQLSATGSYDSRDPDAPVVVLDSHLEALRLEKLLGSQFAPAAQVIEGKLGGKLKLKGTGVDWESLKSSLTGGGALSLDDGVLRKVNIADDLLGRLSGVPGLQLRIPAHLEAQYPAVFGEAETLFENLRGQLTVKNGRVFADNLRLAAADYAITASGSVSLDADVEMKANFSASQALSQSLIDEAKALRYLRASNGRIEIPFRMSGGAAALRIEPDVQYLAERVAPALVGDLLGKLAGKSSRKSKKSEGTRSGEESDPSAEHPPDQRTPEDDAAAAAGALLQDLLRGR